MKNNKVKVKKFLENKKFKNNLWIKILKIKQNFINNKILIKKYNRKNKIKTKDKKLIQIKFIIKPKNVKLKKLN